MKQHPLSAAYPAMPEKELMALAADIKEVGLREPVVMYDGMVLDGWHRCQACQMAEVEIRTVEFDGDDPREFVISKNGFRRHLTASQRAAAIVACMEWRPRGDQRRSAKLPTVEAAAAKAHVSERTMADAKAAHNGGLGKQVRDGKMTASAAAKKARGSSRPERKSAKAPEDKAAKYAAEAKELRDKNGELADELQSFLDAGGDDGQKVIAGLRSQIRALESQRDDLMQQVAQYKREVAGLRKALGRAER